MMLARVKTGTLSGVEAASVDVEVRVRDGKKYFTIIGLGDGAIRESRDRILSALRSCGFRTPEQILVNLAPAELRKEGSAFDVPIAVGILRASGQLNSNDFLDASIHGELALDGRIKRVRGVVAHAVRALESGAGSIIVPKANMAEAGLLSGIHVIGVESLSELASVLRGETVPQVFTPRPKSAAKLRVRLSEVWGQENAKRAMVIAAAGGHNLLMIGPPGCGKSMLAQRFAGLMPPLLQEEMLEVVRIHSVAGLPVEGYLSADRPFRNPHHGISDAGLVGGGSVPRPGEISLAHRGILFLDEFPEFRRSALESLRGPMEQGEVVVARAKGNYKYPARFQLIGAMNPCPCGKLGMNPPKCLCSRTALQAYLKKLSQPILDRIDLHVDLSPVPPEILGVKEGAHASEDADRAMQEAVLLAHDRQRSRSAVLNSEVSPREIGERWVIKPNALSLLKSITEKQGMSARGFMRVLRVARSIADLEGDEQTKEQHIAEAISFRSLERIEHYAGLSRV